jgi:hypothetical protein
MWTVSRASQSRQGAIQPQAVQASDQHLAVIGEMPLDRLDRGRGDALARRVLAQVDDGRARGQRLARAPRQRQPRVPAGFHVLQRLERGCGGTEHDRHAGALRAQHRQVARRITEAALVLLERSVVLFVDDDEPEIGDRREHRRARAEHDARFSGNALAPGREPLGIGERGVQHRHRRIEALAETRDQLRREPDFRHQHQRALTASQRVVRRMEVHLGLAAAGDAIQQEGRKASGRAIDGRDGCRLLGDERRARGPDQVGVGGDGLIRGFRRGRAAARHQGTHRGAPVCEFLRELFRCEAVGRDQRFQHLALARRARQRISRQCRRAVGGREPALGERARSRTLAREFWQRGREHLAQGMVVVLGGEFDQLQYARVDDGFGVEHFEHRLELLARQLGPRGVRMDHADQPLTAEGHAHARARLRRMCRRARRQVIEQAAQGSVERDAQDRGLGQEVALRVFHSVCG